MPIRVEILSVAPNAELRALFDDETLRGALRTSNKLFVARDQSRIVGALFVEWHDLPLADQIRVPAIRIGVFAGAQREILERLERDVAQWEKVHKIARLVWGSDPASVGALAVIERNDRIAMALREQMRVPAGESICIGRRPRRWA